MDKMKELIKDYSGSELYEKALDLYPEASEQEIVKAEAKYKKLANIESAKKEQEEKEFLAEQIKSGIKEHYKEIMPLQGKKEESNDFSVKPSNWKSDLGELAVSIIKKDHEKANRISDSFKKERQLQGKDLASDVATGSFLVPVEFEETIFSAAASRSLMYDGAFKINMNSQTCNVDFMQQGPGFSFTAQNAAIGLNEPTFQQNTLTLQAATSLANISNELLSQSFTSIGEVLTKNWTKDFYRMVSASLTTAAGGPGFGPVGLFNLIPAGQQVALPGAALTYNDLLGLVSLVASGYDNDDCIFVTDRFTFFQQIKGLVDANGSPIIRTDELTGQHRLFGRRVELNDTLGALAPANRFLAYGNTRELVIGDNTGLQIASSADAGFQNNQTVFRAVYHWDMVCPSVGSGSWGMITGI